jgi:hypothetical protein
LVPGHDLEGELAARQTSVGIDKTLPAWVVEVGRVSELGLRVIAQIEVVVLVNDASLDGAELTRTTSQFQKTWKSQDQRTFPFERDKEAMTTSSSGFETEFTSRHNRSKDRDGRTCL